MIKSKSLKFKRMVCTRLSSFYFLEVFRLSHKTDLVATIRFIGPAMTAAKNRFNVFPFHKVCLIVVLRKLITNVTVTLGIRSLIHSMLSRVFLEHLLSPILIFPRLRETLMKSMRSL